MAFKKRLTRSTTDRRIAGVCGGIAEYLNIDSTIIRAIVAILFFTGTLSLWPYLILWMILPNDRQFNSSRAQFNWEPDRSERKDVTNTSTPDESDWSDF